MSVQPTLYLYSEFAPGWKDLSFVYFRIVFVIVPILGAVRLYFGDPRIKVLAFFVPMEDV